MPNMQQDFWDQAQLSNHMAQSHNLNCVVCKSSNFTNRQALTDHSKNCNLANLDEKVGPPNVSGVSTESSTMSLLLKAISESKTIDIPAHTLREIKSIEIKQNLIKKAPELYLKKTDTLLDEIVFEQNQKPLSVPSALYRKTPQV